MLFGLPNLVGLIVAGSLGTIILLIRPQVKKSFLFSTADLLSGFVTVFAGVFIADLLNIRPAAWLPMLAALWFAIHFTRCDKLAQFTRAAFGTFLGWWAYAAYAY